MSEKHNIVKETAKKLGMTQKALAERIKVDETTMSRWAKEKVPVPDWALEMFELLNTEKKFKEAKEKFHQISNIFE